MHVPGRFCCRPFCFLRLRRRLLLLFWLRNRRLLLFLWLHRNLILFFMLRCCLFLLLRLRRRLLFFLLLGHVLILLFNGWKGAYISGTIDILCESLGRYDGRLVCAVSTGLLL